MEKSKKQLIKTIMYDSYTEGEYLQGIPWYFTLLNPFLLSRICLNQRKIPTCSCDPIASRTLIFPYVAPLKGLTTGRSSSTLTTGYC